MHTLEETRMALWMRTYAEAEIRRPAQDGETAANEAVECFDKAFQPSKPCTACASCRFALLIEGEDMRCYALPPNPTLPFVYNPPGDTRRPSVRMGDVSCIHYKERKHA